MDLSDLCAFCFEKRSGVTDEEMRAHLKQHLEDDFTTPEGHVYLDKWVSNYMVSLIQRNVPFLVHF